MQNCLKLKPVVILRNYFMHVDFSTVDMGGVPQNTETGDIKLPVFGGINRGHCHATMVRLGILSASTFDVVN